MKAPAPFPAASSALVVEALTDRQRECLQLVSTGLTSSGIGDRLGLSPRTVDEHLMAACSILGVRTRVQAVARLAIAARRADEPRNLPP